MSLETGLENPDSRQRTMVNMRMASYHPPKSGQQTPPSCSSLRASKTSQHSKVTNSTYMGDSSSTCHFWMSSEHCPYDDTCEPTEEETETEALQESFGSFAQAASAAAPTDNSLQQEENVTTTNKSTSDQLLNLIELTALLADANRPDKYSKRKRTRNKEKKNDLTLEEMARILQHVNASDDADLIPRWDLIQALAYGPSSFEEEEEEVEPMNSSNDEENERRCNSPQFEHSPEHTIIEILDLPERIQSQKHNFDMEDDETEEEVSLDPLELWEKYSSGNNESDDDGEGDTSRDLGETGHENGHENYQLDSQKLKLHLRKQQQQNENQSDSNSNACRQRENEETSLTLSQLEIRSVSDSGSSSDTESTFSLECHTGSVASSVTWQEDGYVEVPVSDDDSDDDEDSSSGNVGLGPMSPTISALLSEEDDEGGSVSTSSSSLPNEFKPGGASSGRVLVDASPYGLGENDSLELHRRNQTRVRNNRREHRRTHPQASQE